MDEQHADFLDGLHVVEAELERVIGELDEMYSRLGIHVLEVVSLWPLQWALNKLADDLRDADSELRNARLEVASARREASEARQQAEEMQGRHELQSVYSAGQAGRIVGLEGVVESLKAERDRLQQQVAELEKTFVQSMRPTVFGGAELSGNSGELPEPEPEPYQWQVGDEIEDSGGVRRPVTDRNANGRIVIRGNGSRPQFEWERRGWKLHRKALPRLTPRHVPLDDLPDIEPMAPQQVAEIAAVTEPIDDSVGTDGEGQS